MRNFWKIMLIAIVSMAVASCGKDDPINPNPPSPTPDKLVMVELTLAAEDMPKVRAMDENVIKDVNVYLYGKMDYHFYFPTVAAALAFETLPGDYQMYVVTNVHKDMGSLTKAELETYVVAYDAMVDDIPMTANVAVKISSSSGAFALPEIQVKRNAAKIGYAIEVGDAVAATIKLQSVQFCNIPKSASLFGTAAASTSKSDYYDSPVINIADAKSYADVFYMFENLQGTVSSITDQKDKSPANAPACASYMKIYAQGVGKVIEYIVYLGENSTSDFNVRKNTRHTMDLVISGENEIDNRVKVYDGLYYGQANSVICDGSQVSFDITPYRTTKSQCYEYTAVYAGKEYEAVAAKIVWQAKVNLISSLRVENNTLIVNTNGQKGNAVVAVCDNVGEILWSFHIWSVGDDAPQDLLCENYVKAQFYVMDRNLGALNNTTADYDNAGGLLYQWGRKDPFPSKNEDYVYSPTQSGIFLSVFPAKKYETQQSIGSLDNLLLQTTKSPASFIFANTWFKQESDKLWGDPQGYKDEYNTVNYKWSANKTVYDPCPIGYRVSNRFTWTGFSLNGDPVLYPQKESTNIIGAWDYGWKQRLMSSDHGVYYPVSQYRMLDGKLSDKKWSSTEETSYWSSTGGQEHSNGPLVGGNIFRFNSTYLMLCYDGDKATRMDACFGYPVRCVKDNN